MTGFIIKLLITFAVITVCALVGKKYPSAAGLIATMPLAGLAVMLLIYPENDTDSKMLMTSYAKGALFGIIPCAFFYVAAMLCFMKNMPLPVVLSISFGVWFAGAVVHQILIK